MRWEWDEVELGLIDPPGQRVGYIPADRLHSRLSPRVTFRLRAGLCPHERVAAMPHTLPTLYTLPTGASSRHVADSGPEPAVSGGMQHMQHMQHMQRL